MTEDLIESLAENLTESLTEKKGARVYPITGLYLITWS
jgi:hypothetical protein